MTPVRDGAAMVAGMMPRLDPQPYVFCTGAAVHPAALCSFREDEGLSQVLPLEAARAAGHEVALPMARIVLDVFSALDGHGLTAAVSGALCAAQIACNMVAAYHHDHLFVPWADRDRALAALLRLQSDAASG
ncbi:ACT domain-containing protein [Novosphingobium colocasiae]|uniref:Uncharacterized protein n=1 Tax=Novosphingobium colocasiae TaxID=1256513 RepID=A0A918PM17_9SPHN|nr:ACT domain-containing protein [Novosphingobium colocasiae]GGZ15539.1 hypothetical protein GCM10011614_33010 [Novosphingobium colocasiae]